MDKTQSYQFLENILVLKKSRLFGDVPTSELRALAAIVEELGLAAGEPIVREGDVGDSMYFIKSGKVRITKKLGSSSETTDLASLGTGECFGEMAAIDEEVRSASVFACEPTILLRINKDDLLDVVLSFPHIGIELLRIFVSRLRMANARMETLSAHKPVAA